MTISPILLVSATPGEMLEKFCRDVFTLFPPGGPKATVMIKFNDTVVEVNGCATPLDLVNKWLKTHSPMDKE